MNQRPQNKIDTLNLIEEKVGNSLEHTGTGKTLLNRTPLIQELRSTINKWHHMKLKSFCMAKDIVIQKKWHLQNKKIFLPTTYLIESYYQKYKKAKKPIVMIKTNNPN